MIRGARDFKRTGDENAIKRAIDMPHRTRERINYAISVYGQPELEACLLEAGTTTIAELNSELTTMEEYATGLYDRRTVNVESWDSLADDILTNVQDEVIRWTFPFPPDYTDIWE